MTPTGYNPSIAIHPGETVKDTLEVLGVSQADLSLSTGLTEKTISEILNGKNPITPETALKFERALGISKIGLLNMQSQYDADMLYIKELKRLEKETVLLKSFKCYLELQKLKYVKVTRNKIEKVEELLRFFGVDSLSAIPNTMPIAFRRSNISKINNESLAAWLRIGNIEANKLTTDDFNVQKLRSSLNQMRMLTIERPEVYSVKLQDLCSKCGIALVFTPYLKNTNVNGATRWLTPKRALIQLSLRYTYADSLWFTFFHEIGHLLNHSKKEVFINFQNRTDNLELEMEADKFAEKILIPEKESFEQLKETINFKNYSSKIIAYSKNNNIDPGIVAGRLGKETNNWKLYSQFRKKLILTTK